MTIAVMAAASAADCKQENNLKTTDMALYPNLIKEALQTVRYPGTGKDIISMEMLEDDIRICLNYL